MRNLDSANAEGAKPIALCILDDSDEGPRAMPRQKSLNYTRSLESTHTPCLVEQCTMAILKRDIKGLQVIYSLFRGMV